MKHLFDATAASELKARIERLRADSPRQWGKMTPAQAMAHCAIVMEVAVGDRKPPRMLIGRIIGPMVKRKILRPGDPPRNSPTDRVLVVADERDVDAERRRLIALVDRFCAAGHAGCTTHPHMFFGSMTPDEWSLLMYKHIDHHLRQFAG
jgi:hypothetical protein